MIESILLRSCSSPILADVKDIHRTGLSPASRTRFASTIRCSSSSDAYIPKLEPFSRTKLERAVKDPPLIEKCESELADYCSALEGDDSYSCWRAYFELKDLEKETPKEDVERIILQAGGVKSLIGCLHGIASIHHKQNGNGCFTMATQRHPENEGKTFIHVPDGLPKTAEELEEEERARMPDSPFTRLLRTKGTCPSWYSPEPQQ
ncbi:hypothetical protein COLO4_11735 [Corchorus olitorius]|uniref:CCG-binding protein 1 n=1 Tax=Corchorus olitorius TaxID=93759 RepID=A0A1R3K3C2_9ROSI|nr:hypothetical protein COLO4_11735 [Corchorus olitorius]